MPKRNANTWQRYGGIINYQKKTVKDPMFDKIYTRDEIYRQQLRKNMRLPVESIIYAEGDKI